VFDAILDKAIGRCEAAYGHVAIYNGERAHPVVTDTIGNLVSLLFLGLLLGVRHATDPDHVVAIATIVSRQRNLRGSAMIGAVWGLGHTLTILAVGGAIILFGVVIPPRLGLAMEFSVGIMLILLGVLTLTGMGGVIRQAASLVRESPQPIDHVHAHGDYVHRHAGSAGAEEHNHREDNTPLARLDAQFGGLRLYQWLRPLAVGIVHGLAGSAAVALLVLTLVRDPVWAIAYLFLFGVGTIGGMMAITLGLSAPFAFTSSSLPRLNVRLRAAAGLISFAFGLFLIYEIGFADGGLFTNAPNWEPQ
jgi:high-affinity nickel-transport protein